MIQLKNISIGFGDLELLDNFNINFNFNKITCLMGPSGVGKSTIANMVAGLIKPDKGSITGIENAVYSYVFQEPRLLEWYSVFENIDFVLRDIYDSEKRKKIAEGYINMVGLADFRDYKPRALSGGMAQRVSLARAFAYPSNILIMDEPFKGLDVKLKQEMMELFQRLWTESKRTVIFITHDMEEAINLSHSIYVLKGSPAQVAKEFYDIKECDRSILKRDLEDIM